MILPNVNLCGVFGVLLRRIRRSGILTGMRFNPLPNTAPADTPVIDCTAVTVAPIPVIEPAANAPAIIDDTDDLHNPDLIWSKPLFPSKTRPFRFVPQQLYATLMAYADTITPLTTLLSTAGIDYGSFCDLSDRYPEINKLYGIARVRRAQKWGEIAEKTHESLPDDDRFYQTDDFGRKTLTAAGAAFLKNKAAIAHRVAAVMETGTFIATSKQENINRNLSLNVTVSGKLPDGFDLATADPSDIVAAIKGRRK